MKILITGGGGYVGSMLANYLSKKNYDVTILDLMIYEPKLFENDNKIKVVKGDIRNLNLLKKILPGHNTVIHLACISNDPSFELNPKLGKSINLDSFEPLVKMSREANVEKFIFASSSSVYGVSDEKNVTEELELHPLTDYSKYKVECEKILLKYQQKNITLI